MPPCLAAIKNEFAKIALQVTLSAVGFLIALAINSALANRGERATYNALLKSLCAEAAVNKDSIGGKLSQTLSKGNSTT